MRYLFLLAAAAGLLPSTAAQTLNALIPGSSLLRFGTYDAETGTWLDLDTLDFAEAFISGTGSWDHWEGRYLVAGYGPGAATASLWSWDGAENQLVHSPSLGGDIGALHQDLSTALFYGLGFAVVDSTFVDLGSGFGYWEYDMELEVRSIDPAARGWACSARWPTWMPARCTLRWAMAATHRGTAPRAVRCFARACATSSACRTTWSCRPTCGSGCNAACSR